MRADAVAVLHPSAHSLVEGKGTVRIKRIAEHHLLRCRVDAEFAVLGTDFLQLLQVVPAVHAQAAEHARKMLREVVRESLEAERVVEEDAQAADKRLLPHVHSDMVSLLRTVHAGNRRDELVRHCADGGDVVLHSKPHRAASCENSRPLYGLRRIVERPYYGILSLVRETPTTAEVGYLQSALQHTHGLVVRLAVVGIVIHLVDIARHDVIEFRHDSEHLHLEQHSLVPVSLEADVQMPLFVLLHRHPVGLVAEAF